MKQIERITRDGDTMYFEKLNKKEVSEVINDWYRQSKDNPMFLYDSAMYWELEDGSSGSLSPEERDPKPPAYRVTKLYVDTGGHCISFYGYENGVEFNERYGDWEVGE